MVLVVSPVAPPEDRRAHPCAAMTPKNPELHAGEQEVPGHPGLPWRRPRDSGDGTIGPETGGPAPVSSDAGIDGNSGSGEIYNRVSALLEAGRLGEAGALLLKGLEIYPESVDLLKELGVLYHLQGLYGKAARTFTRVMNISGEGKQSLSWKIVSLSSKAMEELSGPEPGESIATFDQILDLDPSDREALAGKITALRILGRAGEAWDCLMEGAGTGPPGASLLYQEGWLDMDGDRPDLAEGAFGRAALADPAWPDPVFSRGLALVRLGRAAEAGRFLRDWVESAGADPELRARLGWFSLALHDPTHARAIFTGLAEGGDEPGGSHGLAAALLSLGLIGDARAILERLAPSFPRDPLLQVNLGMVLAQGEAGRDLADAAIAAKRALSLSLRFAPAHTCLGMVAFREGDFGAAEAHLAEALRLGDPSGERNLGLFFCTRGGGEEAESRLLRATLLDPLDARAWAGLGAIVLARGEREEGLRHLRQANLLDPRDIGTVRGLSLALAGSGAPEEAGEVIRRGLALTAGLARRELLLELAAHLVSAGGPGGDPVLDREAGKALASAEELRPGDPATRFYRGVIEGRHGHPREAVDLFTPCLESAEFRAPAHENIRRLEKNLRAGWIFPGRFLPVRALLALLILLQLAASWYLFLARLVSEPGFLLLLLLFSVLMALVAFLPARAGKEREILPELVLPERGFIPEPVADMASPLFRLRTSLRPRRESDPRP